MPDDNESDADLHPSPTPRTSYCSTVVTKLVKFDRACHSDLTGRFPSQSINGSQYVMVMICEIYFHLEPMNTRGCHESSRLTASLQYMNASTTNHLNSLSATVLTRSLLSASNMFPQMTTVPTEPSAPFATGKPTSSQLYVHLTQPSPLSPGTIFSHSPILLLTSCAPPPSGRSPPPGTASTGPTTSITTLSPQLE